MEYREFKYTNDLGQVELPRGSVFGAAASWVIIQSLKITLIVVIAGFGFAVFKYFDTNFNAVSAVDPFSPAAVYSSTVPAIDYGHVPLPAEVVTPRHPAPANRALRG